MEQILIAYGLLIETVTDITMLYKTRKQWFAHMMETPTSLTFENTKVGDIENRKSGNERVNRQKWVHLYD